MASSGQKQACTLRLWWALCALAVMSPLSWRSIHTSKNYSLKLGWCERNIPQLAPLLPLVHTDCEGKPTRKHFCKPPARGLH